VEVRAALPAFIDALTWSLNWSLKLMPAPREKMPLYYMRSGAHLSFWRKFPTRDCSHCFGKLFPIGSAA
jgi:hypothetical protein